VPTCPTLIVGAALGKKYFRLDAGLRTGPRSLVFVFTCEIMEATHSGPRRVRLHRVEEFVDTTTTSGVSGTVLLITSLVSLVIWLVIIWGTVHIAGKKNRSKFGWGVLAFFFSLIALIIVAVMPVNNKTTA